MAQKQNGGGGKHRKPGDWKVLAAGRARNQRDIINGRGLSNIPKLSDVGSAAYRRLLSKGGSKRRAA